MKYYAVTNDPAELMHYGVKGMKWGVIRTDAQLGHPKKPRSAAYKRASNKLSKMMRSGIKKAEAHWQEYNSPANKKARAKEREAKQFEKYMQQAREGRLKYGKLSDAQVKKVTDRLFLERQARQLGGMEKSSFRRRLKEAVGTGIISGVGQGVSTIVGENIGRRSKLKTQRLQNEQNEYFDKRRERRQAKNQDKADQRRLDRDFENQKRKDKYADENWESDLAKRMEERRLQKIYDNRGLNEATEEATKRVQYNELQRNLVAPYLNSRDPSYNRLGTGTALARLNADIERTERQQAQMRAQAKANEKGLSMVRRAAMSKYTKPRASTYSNAMKTWSSEIDAKERKAQSEAAAASYAARQISKENEERRNRQLTYNQGLSPRVTAADINAQRRNMGQSRTRQIRRRSFKG